MIYSSTVTTQLSVSFLSESKRESSIIALNTDNSDLFKYVSTISMQFLGSFLNLHF